MINIGTSETAPSGELTFVETQSPAGASPRCAVMDSDYLVMFLGVSDVNTYLKTYTYIAAGNATLVDEWLGAGGAGAVYQIALDTTTSPKLVFVVTGGGIFSLSYDSSANLTPVDSELGVTFARGVTLDVGRNLVFAGDNGSVMRSFPYTDLGVFGRYCPRVCWKLS